MMVRHRLEVANRRFFDASLLPRASDTRTELPESKEIPYSGEQLGKAVRRSALWSAGGTIALRFGNILLMGFVARIMVPEEFGIFALAITVHAFMVSVAELGVAASLARADLNAAKIAPTVNTIAIVTALAMAIPMFVFAEQLSWLLGSVEAAVAIRILAIGVALIGPFAVPGATLQRQFKQHQIFLATIAGFVPGSLYLAFAVLNGGGVEALAWSRVVAQILSGLLMVYVAGGFTRLGLDWKLVGGLLAFGIPLAMSNLLSQVLLNIDNLFVGRLLGVEALGAYSIAFSVSVWSTAVLGTMLNSVVLPGVTSVIRDGGDLQMAIANALRMVAWVAAPIATVTFAFASPLIRVVYGPQWDASGPVLRTLAVYGFVFVLGLLLANVIIATGRTTALFWVQLAALVGLLPALPLGIHLGGSVGAGWAHVVVVAGITLPVYLVALNRTTRVGVKQVAANVLPSIVSAIIAAAAAYILTLGLEHALGKTLVGGLICAGFYLLMSWRTAKKMLIISRSEQPSSVAKERV